jgi:hypothetical protein
MIVSMHEYILRPGVEEGAFLQAVDQARQEGLFSLPGLKGFHFLRGLRGVRAGEFASIWFYDSRAAWEALWGPLDAPHPQERYPQGWHRWEQELLAPLLDRPPDEITYTAYEAF